MGVIVDTSTLVSAERRKHSVSQIFSQLRDVYGNTGLGLSVVTVAELAHGIERANLEVHRENRQAFLDDLISEVTIYPVTLGIALLAGRISGRQSRRGLTISFEDLLIGATALHHQCEVMTENVGHFEMIPGLVVKKL